MSSSICGTREASECSDFAEDDTVFYLSFSIKARRRSAPWRALNACAGVVCRAPPPDHSARPRGFRRCIGAPAHRDDNRPRPPQKRPPGSTEEHPRRGVACRSKNNHRLTFFFLMMARRSPTPIISKKMTNKAPRIQGRAPGNARGGVCSQASSMSMASACEDVDRLASRDIHAGFRA